MALCWWRYTRSQRDRDAEEASSPWDSALNEDQGGPEVGGDTPPPTSMHTTPP
eukprot:CAMPEP_0174379666 /NCGR_PEP_ID=MMETSP0811_2-20130205/122862_1 /TAXON_ID=73025 ORGANISM="Eutreptiella gymnastica-like, Strain CCMP1594" /NCGR_SAMPLE_ID=MMETSP0811_2 /ASSEMBLY_ACC=CAM_ASM_000667 /LENGTH=52 /DNA_ID=CAMNT_0015532277 /DNA_START=1102 /DNA_END=1260 /DNA_ORIENTATION=+